MKHRPRSLSLAEFSETLGGLTNAEVSGRQMRSLHGHYSELVTWGVRLSLIGPASTEEVIRRHFAESLTGLELIERVPQNLVDVGSGGGFPGLVLAAMMPSVPTFLVEANQKKWAFLKAASRRTVAQVQCLDHRLADILPQELPGEIDLITLRAIRLPAEVWRRLAGRLSPGGSILVWRGTGEPLIGVAGGPSKLGDIGLVRQRSIRVPGSQRRCVVSYGVEADRS